jgi:two-component system chemotaxis response regulator CheY
MIVDDSRIVYAQMKNMLEGSDIEVVGYCRCGEEALEQYEKLQPELVTMDIVMPGMDGVETCRKLMERWPDANVLMVSSLAYDDTMDSAAANGAKGFLFKPFTKESLLDGIKKALGEDTDADAVDAVDAVVAAE